MSASGAESYVMFVGVRHGGNVVLVPSTADETAVVVPEALTKKLDHAWEMVRAAEDEIARWVKFTDRQGYQATALGPIIERLPTTEEWKEKRKKR